MKNLVMGGFVGQLREALRLSVEITKLKKGGGCEDSYQ